MAIINIRLWKTGADGYNPSIGHIEFRPTARFDSTILEDTELLPSPVIVTLDENGEASLDLEATTPSFAWRVREYIEGGETYFVEIPENLATFNLKDLTRVDPSTLTEEAQVAAWADLEAQIYSLQTEVDDIQENNAVSAEQSFAVVGGTLGTQPTFSGTPLFEGSFIKMGNLVHYRINVSFSNITSFGTGQYFLELPFNAKYGTMFRGGCLHRATNGKQYAINGHVLAGSNQMMLFYTDGTGLDADFDYNSPFSLTVNDTFHVSGEYIQN